MSLYHLTDRQHKELDTIRGRFFCKEIAKHSNTTWQDGIVSLSQRIDGMAIINTRRLNDCLLVKWIWKIINKEDSLWCKLMYKKYMGDTGIFSTKRLGGS
jgi:hypothetical protein